MQITGEMLIGQAVVRGTGKVVHAINPATGAAIAEPAVASGGIERVERACRPAEAAFDPYPHASLDGSA